ncbi:6-phosphogluconolactonase [Candidatus Leptofilum sp.]|uniref:6-phosphogluconolactonase n=1 Tax=Candidatus Leptofilum sp. TaxID=3241576 RepID=UPI003B593A3B
MSKPFTKAFTLHVLDGPEAFNQFGAQYLTALAQAAVAQHGRFNLALSGGGTPAGIYTLLGERPYRQQMPWQQTHLYWGDERLVPPNDPGSNFGQINELLLKKVPIPNENIHRARGEWVMETAVADYINQLQAITTGSAIPIFDVVLLGMGSDGHTASLFPNSPVAMPEWVVGVITDYDGRPAHRISLTPTVINHARHIIFLVSGGSKAETLQKVLYGRSQPEQLPAQRIQPTHGTLTWLLDTAAAQNLTKLK